MLTKKQKELLQRSIDPETGECRPLTVHDAGCVFTDLKHGKRVLIYLINAGYLSYHTFKLTRKGKRSTTYKQLELNMDISKHIPKELKDIISGENKDEN